MKYFNKVAFYLEGSKTKKPTDDGVSSGKWMLVDEETVTPQYSLPEVLIVGEHPIWSLPGYKGKQSKYRNFTTRDKDQIWQNWIKHNQAGVDYLKNIGKVGLTTLGVVGTPVAAMTAPLALAGGIAGGLMTDEATKTVSKGKYNNFGEFAGDKLGIDPYFAGYLNPGYFVGGAAAPKAVSAVKSVGKAAAEGIQQVGNDIVSGAARTLEAIMPLRQAVAVANRGGYHVEMPGNYSRMNWTVKDGSFEAKGWTPWGLKRALKAAKAAKEQAPSTPETPETPTTPPPADAPKGKNIVNIFGNRKTIYKSTPVTEEVPIMEEVPNMVEKEFPIMREKEVRVFENSPKIRRVRPAHYTKSESVSPYDGEPYEVPIYHKEQTIVTRPRKIKEVGKETKEFLVGTETRPVQEGTKLVNSGKRKLNPVVDENGEQVYEYKTVGNDEQLNLDNEYTQKLLGLIRVPAKRVRTNTGTGYYNTTTGQYDSPRFYERYLNNLQEKPGRTLLKTLGIGIPSTYTIRLGIAAATGKGVLPEASEDFSNVGNTASRAYYGTELHEQRQRVKDSIKADNEKHENDSIQRDDRLIKALQVFGE